MPKYKECVMTDNQPCTDCNMCDMCDLDPDKVCDNCFKCIDNPDADYAGIEIDEILTDENSIVLDELDLNDMKKEAANPMEYVLDDGDTLSEEAYDADYEGEEESEEDYE